MAARAETLEAKKLYSGRVEYHLTKLGIHGMFDPNKYKNPYDTVGGVDNAVNKVQGNTRRFNAGRILQAIAF